MTDSAARIDTSGDQQSESPFLPGDAGAADIPTSDTSAADRPNVLYNGIELPTAWPPHLWEFSWDELTPPYLLSPPEVIPIDVGRQLFVDDFLIQESTLIRHFHEASYRDGPVLKADYPWEGEGESAFAAPYSDGIFYDPAARKFKMWYQCGFLLATCYAESVDGVSWNKPLVDGNNLIKGIEPNTRDSSTVWLDLLEPDPGRRYKLLVFHTNGSPLWDGNVMLSYVSSDGVRWSSLGGADVMIRNDRTTFFFNPFRNVWVFSIRAIDGGLRARYYLENSAFRVEALRQGRRPVPWVVADHRDRVLPITYADGLPDLYNLDAVAYESIMVGLFTIHAKRSDGTTRRPKLTYVTLGYSRDGFHWHRPNRNPFIGLSENSNDWNWGNVQSVGGGFLVVRDKLHFYASGRRGGLYNEALGSTGLVSLRRDGFVSMDAQNTTGILTTRPVVFSGKHLFVNAATAGGELRVELLSENGNPISPFTASNSNPISDDKTLIPVTWRGANDLSAVAGTNVRFRFHLSNGQLFSFWVSQSASGASNGYVAAGGPGFTTPHDTAGIAAYSVPSP